jgi:hypothetical protein
MNKQTTTESGVFYAAIARLQHGKHMSAALNTTQQWRSHWQQCVSKLYNNQLDKLVGLELHC